MPRKPKTPPIVCEFYVWQLFQRADVWYADGRAITGDGVKHSLGTKDYHEALQQLRELDRVTAIRLGLTTEQPVETLPEISVVEGWRLYLENRGRSQGLGGVAPSSLKRYRSIRAKHLHWCRENGIERWSQFNRTAYEKCGNWMFSRGAPRTCYTDLTQLKSVIKWLVEEGLLPPECRFSYKLRKPDGSDAYCPRPEEVNAMIALCDRDPELVWLARILLTLAHLGLRISELASLRWSDFDRGLEFVRVADERASGRKGKKIESRTTKGRRSRVIPIHPLLRKMLVQMERSTDGRVFHAARGGALRPNNARVPLVRDVVEVLKVQFPTPAGEIGFESVRFHSLRHYFCSQCFLGGASEGEIREWMGHSDSKIVELYRHLRREDAARKMQQIEFLPQSPDEKADSA